VCIRLLITYNWTGNGREFMSLIDNDQQVLREALVNAMRHADRLDVLSGYFYLSGFESLDDSLTNLKVRILVGMEVQTDLVLIINSQSSKGFEVSLDRFQPRTPTRGSLALVRNYKEALVGFINNTDSLSFRIVVQMPRDSGAVWPRIHNPLMHARDDGSDEITLHYKADVGEWQALIAERGALISASSKTAFLERDWIDLVMTIDFSTHLKLYVNGELASTEDTSTLSTLAGLSAWKLGASHGDDQSGFVISEFFVFDRVLSDKEIIALYKAGGLSKGQD